MKNAQPPSWGIEPVPPQHQTLGFFDFLVLWGNLGIGLLVLLAGSFLVPGLSFSEAAGAIVIGSLIGCFLLALVGVIGSELKRPTMVPLRSILGLRGPYLPSLLNVIQLLGWTVFEFVIMGYTANAILKSLFSFDNYILTTAISALIVIFMGLKGLAVIRHWLRKIAVWIVLATTVFITYRVVSMHDMLPLLLKAGDGSLSFWTGVDLVIAMPISWLALVADYSRFAKKTSSAFYGTFLGYFFANAWMYAVGALLLLATGITQETHDFVTAVLLLTGWLALLILLVDETKEAWADLYSSVISAQNIFPRLNYKKAIIGFGIAAFLVAAAIDITRYQNFLYLIGSVFIPLFALLIADYFIFQRGVMDSNDLYKPNGTFWFAKGINIGTIIIWFMGIGIYQYIAHQALTIGASLPTFIAVFLLYSAYRFGIKAVKYGQV